MKKGCQQNNKMCQSFYFFCRKHDSKEQKFDCLIKFLLFSSSFFKYLLKLSASQPQWGEERFENEKKCD